MSGNSSICGFCDGFRDLLMGCGRVWVYEGWDVVSFVGNRVVGERDFGVFLPLHCRKNGNGAAMKVFERVQKVDRGLRDWGDFGGTLTLALSHRGRGDNGGGGLVFEFV